MWVEQATQKGRIEGEILKNISRLSLPVTVGGIVAILALMILPLPASLLDLLLGVNLVGALTILFVSLSISHPMKFSSFPTLLLISTLFRLGLNLASTRLILSQGEAGAIIRTFGSFATGGDLMTGLLMFLILTVIQFVVISKGSERIAEVTARFTLDALPGRQMSIDADLRAGLIAQGEATNQRRELQRESRMYGALDGAMKFVKGDAIASLLITAINLLGGLFAGVVRDGLPFKTATEIYSILTVGDGLVSQIPSIMASITAGFIVTRVPDDRLATSLGTDIGLQLVSQPGALFAASFTCFLLGLVPGFPSRVFFALGATTAAGSALLLFRIRKKLDAPQPVASFTVQPDVDGSLPPLTPPLRLQVGEELYRIFLQDQRWGRFFNRLYPRLKNHLSREIGIPYPDLKVEISPDLGGSFKYRIQVYEILSDTGLINPHGLLHYGALPGHESAAIRTFHGTSALLFQLTEKARLSAAGIDAFEPEEVLLKHLARVLKRCATHFVGIQEVRELLARLEGNAPDLVSEVVPKMMSIQKLTEVISRLVEEGIPVRDFRLILSTLANLQPEGKDPVLLTEQVRLALGPIITHLFAGPQRELNALALDDEIGEEIRGAIRKSGSECYLDLDPERQQAINDWIGSRLLATPFTSRPVLLTDAAIRRYVRKLIEKQHSRLPVLSYQEVDPEVVIHHVRPQIEPVICLESV